MKAIINNENNKDKENKIILDPEKLYKNQIEIKMLMNESKMHSPIVLVDPTFKDRNALAALSNETLNTFKKACVSFLNNPSLNFFIKKDQEREFRNKNKSNIKDLITLEINTHRQSGDIAGTKLKKAYNFLLHDMKRFFDIKDSFFTYDEKENKAKIIIIAKTKKEIIFTGPPIEMKEQFQKFKKMHNKIIIKNKISSAIEKGYSSFKEFLQVFQPKNEKALESMGVGEIKIL
jgi:tRNA nucleotidyltransferase (CCA-adding enzyme)